MREKIGKPTRVIGMGVGHGEHVDTQDLPRPEKRPDDRLARVEIAARKPARVDHHHAAIRQLGDRRVALADVEKRHPEDPGRVPVMDPPADVGEEHDPRHEQHPTGATMREKDDRP
jgi:hypothetical protein